MNTQKNLSVTKEPNFSNQTVAVNDHSKLIKARETPVRQISEPNHTFDRLSAVQLRPIQHVQSNGSHAKLIARDQYESSTNTITPITDRPEDASVQSTAARECATANRSDECRISIRPSNDYVTTSVQPSQLHAALSNQSSESVVCRICHLSATESNTPLDETGCDCRGSLRLCHRRCVEHWMLVKMSKQCEICQQPFKYDIVIPEYQIQGQFPPAAGHVDGPGALAACQDSRRLLFFIIYILLLFTAGTSTTLSIFSREEHMKRKPLNVTLASIEIAARNERMYAYGVSLAVTIFVGFHMIAIGVLWVIAEAIVLPRERLLRHHIEVFRNIYAAQLQESSYIWRNGGSAEAGGAGGLGSQATASSRRGNPIRPTGQHARTDGNGQIRRPPTPRFREQRRVPEIIVQAGNQLALPFRRQGFNRPAPPPVMRRLAEGHRAVAVGYRRQEGPRPFDEVAQANLDRNIPHEFPMTRTQPGFLEIFAVQIGNSSPSENNEGTETGNRRPKGVDERDASQNPSTYLAEGDQGDQNKTSNIEMQDLSEEASKSEAAACCTSHIISKRQPDSSEDK